jgi:hypothetical protein
VSRRLKTGLALTALCASLVGLSGCEWDEGYITHDGRRWGEWTQASGGILVVLYRTRQNPTRDANSTDSLLALYRHYRQTHNIQGASTLTLRYMRQFCNDGGNPFEDYARERCLAATAADEWSDFRNDSLVPVDNRGGECIAVHVRSGENWTTRGPNDRHCMSVCEICRPMVNSQRQDPGHGEMAVVRGPRLQ